MNRNKITTKQYNKLVPLTTGEHGQVWDINTIWMAVNRNKKIKIKYKIEKIKNKNKTEKKLNYLTNMQ